MTAIAPPAPSPVLKAQTTYSQNIMGSKPLAATGISPQVRSIIAASPPSGAGAKQPTLAELTTPNVLAVAHQQTTQAQPQSPQSQADIISTAAVNPNIAQSEVQTLHQEQGTPVTVNGLTYANQSIANQYAQMHAQHQPKAVRRASPRTSYGHNRLMRR